MRLGTEITLVTSGSPAGTPTTSFAIAPSSSIFYLGLKLAVGRAAHTGQPRDRVRLSFLLFKYADLYTNFENGYLEL
jgi:hypothetical protein